MSEAYIATFSLGVSKVYLVTWTFRSIDFRSVSGLYIASFDPCVRNALNLEIPSVLFLSFWLGLWTNFHSLSDLTFDLYIFFSWASMRRYSSKANLKCR